MFEIKPYFMYDIEDACVLQNGNATVMLKDKDLITFLKQIERAKKRSILSEEIEAAFGDSAEIFLDFLVENNIIQKSVSPSLAQKEVILLHNNEAFSSLFQEIISPSYKYLKTLPLKDNTKFEKNSHEILYIVFMNPFIMQEYFEICDQLEKENLAYKTCFFYNHSLYLSNFHKHEWFNPCPKCFFYALESQLRGKGGVYSDAVNFQTLLDLIYTHTERFPVEAKLKPLEYISIIKLISEQISCSKDFNKIYDQVFEYKLYDGRLNSDYAYYWEICDCYE